MKWTDQEPGEAGHYWLRGTDGIATVVEIEWDDFLSCYLVYVEDFIITLDDCTGFEWSDEAIAVPEERT